MSNFILLWGTLEEKALVDSITLALKATQRQEPAPEGGYLGHTHNISLVMGVRVPNNVPLGCAQNNDNDQALDFLFPCISDRFGHFGSSCRIDLCTFGCFPSEGLCLKLPTIYPKFRSFIKNCALSKSCTNRKVDILPFTRQSHLTCCQVPQWTRSLFRFSVTSGVEADCKHIK